MLNRVLIIGNAPGSLRHYLKDAANEYRRLSCSCVDWPSFRLTAAMRNDVDLIVPVIDSNIAESARFLNQLHETPIRKPVMAILSHGCELGLFQLASRVSDDYVSESAQGPEIHHRLTRLFEKAKDEVAVARKTLIEEMGLAQLVGRDPAFVAQISKIPLLARASSPVLISGETGTGKELCARAIHNLGDRQGHPFIPMDCGAFPDHLFENELFGHVRGAYTDAHRDQKGLVALAEGGTLFLDEVDSLSPAAQSKLLRFLQERTYRPLGSDRFLKANVRLIAASNRDLEAISKTRLFRLDLFFRLCVLRLHATALRDRRGDVEVLADHFLSEICQENCVPKKSLAASTARLLRRHDWPGNVRELYNVIQQCVTFVEGDVVLPQHLPASFEALLPDQRLSYKQARFEVLQAFERRYVEEMLRECDGNVTHAARLAQKERRVFGRLIKRHNIRRGPRS